MYRLLLPIDGNETRAMAAVESVIEMPCASSEIEVTLLNVFEEIDAADDTGRVDSGELYEQVDLPETVGRAREQLDAADIETKVRHEHGDPASTILDVADSIDADGIVIAGRRRSPAGKLLFGSVTQAVLLHSDVPVTVSMTS